jgi:hypothetical protein
MRWRRCKHSVAFDKSLPDALYNVASVLEQFVPTTREWSESG